MEKQNKNGNELSEESESEKDEKNGNTKQCIEENKDSLNGGRNIDKEQNEKLKGLIKRNAFMAKNMFLGNDIFAPYNYHLRVYDSNINETLKKIEEKEEEEAEKNEDEEYRKLKNDLKSLELFNSETVVSKDKAEKSHEEKYKENELKERRNKLRMNVIKNLTAIQMQINIKETDEYSSLKKLHKLKMEAEEANERKNKKKKKRKKGRSILNSIINESVTDKEIFPVKENDVVLNQIEEQIGTEDVNGKTSSSVSLVKKNILNVLGGTNIEAPVIKKEDDENLLSSNVLKDITTLDLYKKTRKPKWHYPYKLYRVILGHSGWVNCVDVDISNEWFVTGSNDRLIKIWDLASCKLKLTLTGHINSIRDVKISKRNPYLFSCGEDNRVKCWDLEYNKVIRDYHGHLSGVYCLALHPSFDILMSGGRDSVVRVWDIRTKTSIFVLSGHTGTIMSLASQSVEPQIISGSQDKMIRLWDLNNGKCRIALTHHKKSIRSLSIHPFEYSFCSGAADNVKVWNGADAEFDRNITGFNSIINCSLIKQDPYFNDSSILILGSNNGQLHFYDWSSGYKYDTLVNKIVPGTVESENSTLAMAFDKSESRLITTHGDKSIKIWKENEEATPENFPIKWNPHEHYKI